MKNDSAVTSRFKIEIIVGVILILIAVGIFFAHHPIQTKSKDALANAKMPPQLGHGEVLLVLPDKSTFAESFPSLDFSFAWYSILTQEVGPFSISLAKDVQPNVLMGKRLIVIPARTASGMSESQIAMVENAVSAGSSLLIEMPPPAWGNLTAIRKKTQSTSTIKHFTDAPNTPLPSVLRDHLLNFPLDAPIQRIDSLDNEVLPPSNLLLELDGAIAHYQRALGAGNVFVLTFDMGQAITALQQGRPNDDFSITPAPDAPFNVPSDLILHNRLSQNFVPYGDILKRHVLQSIWRTSPQATIWPFPNAEKSTIIMTHDASQIGDQANYIIEDEKKNSISSTFIVSTRNTTERWLSTLSTSKHEVGALFLRPPADVSIQRMGPRFFSPVHRERNISAQRKLISKRAHQNVISCRKYDGLWSSDYTTSFREITASQCRIDLTYAPGNKQHGYIFGTGFPFLPIDRAGLPYPVYEFPTLMTDANPDAIDPKAAIQLVKDSAEYYHEPLVFNATADAMRTHPHYQSIDTWLQVTELAKKSMIRMTTVQDFMQQFSLRKQAAISSTFNESTRKLDVRVDLPDSQNAFTIAVPTRTRYGSIQSITFDQNPYENLTTATGGIQTLIPVIPGSHRLIIQY